MSTPGDPRIRVSQFAIIMCTLKKESMDFDTPRLPNTVHRNIIEG